MDDDTPHPEHLSKGVHEVNTDGVVPGHRPFEIPSECMGPAMLALKSEKQQRFAYLMGCGDMNMDAAMRAAGYQGNANTSALSSWGSTMLHHNPRIAAAIEEVARKVLYGFVPVCIRNIGRMVNDEKNRRHYEASVMVLDRCGFGPKSEHHLTVEHVDDSRLVSFAMKLAEEMAVEPMKLLGRLDGVLLCTHDKHVGPIRKEDVGGLWHYICGACDATVEKPAPTVTDAEGMVYPVVKSPYGPKWVLTPPGDSDDPQG